MRTKKNSNFNRVAPSLKFEFEIYLFLVSSVLGSSPRTYFFTGDFSATTLPL